MERDLSTLTSLGAPPAPSFSRTRSDVEAYRAGEPAAFDRIWTRFRPGLEVFLLGKLRQAMHPSLRTRLQDEIEDILQDVASEVLADFETFEYRGPGSLLAWMRQITEHQVQDHIRFWTAHKRNLARERRLRRHASRGVASHAGSGPGEPATPGPGPATEASLAENRRRVAEALAGLSEREYAIAWYRFFAGAAWAEIAELVGAPSPDAVRMECTLKVLPRLGELLAGG